MRAILKVIALVLAAPAFFLACSGRTGPVDMSDDLKLVDYEPGQIIVGFSRDISIEEAQAVIVDLGLTWIRTLSVRVRIGLVGVPIGTEVEWVAKLKNHDLVEIAQLNHNNIIIR